MTGLKNDTIVRAIANAVVENQLTPLEGKVATAKYSTLLRIADAVYTGDFNLAEIITMARFAKKN